MFYDLFKFCKINSRANIFSFSSVLILSVLTIIISFFLQECSFFPFIKEIFSLFALDNIFNILSLLIVI